MHLVRALAWPGLKVCAERAVCAIFTAARGCSSCRSLILVILLLVLEHLLVEGRLKLLPALGITPFIGAC